MFSTEISGTLGFVIGKLSKNEVKVFTEKNNLEKLNRTKSPIFMRKKISKYSKLVKIFMLYATINFSL